MAYVTFDLPFIIGAKVELEPNNINVEIEELSKQIDQLLDKPYLDEKDSGMLDSLVERKLKLHRENINFSKMDMFEDHIYVQIRQSAIYPLAMIWLIFFILIPKKLVEFVGALVLPIIMFVFQIIIVEEILTIIGLAVLFIIFKLKKYNVYS